MCSVGTIQYIVQLHVCHLLAFCGVGGYYLCMYKVNTMYMYIYKWYIYTCTYISIISPPPMLIVQTSEIQGAGALTVLYSTCLAC